MFPPKQPIAVVSDNPSREGKLNPNNLITKEWKQQGLSLNEPDDHVLELRYQGKVLARFSQSGATPENILKVAGKALRERVN